MFQKHLLPSSDETINPKKQLTKYNTYIINYFFGLVVWPEEGSWCFWTSVWVSV